MSTIYSDNKRIAKNTVVLFFRMLVTILVSLYTSRVVLQTLGVEDYGIFGVVGGVVTMLSFLNASMSGATSRFLTYALAEDDDNEFNETFSTSVIIHVMIAIIILIMAETLGLWLVSHKLVIPEDRQIAANIIYQFCILSTLASILQTPYNACIIANERMDAYAAIEIVNVLLKLAIVCILPIIPSEKLITYGFLYFLVSLLICFTYHIYCRKRFTNTQFHFIWKKEILVPMLSYCGWDLYGNMADTVKQQGTNLIINHFFGILLNAASTVATQVDSAVNGLAANVIQAFRPQIIKSYALGEIRTMENHICNAMKFTILLYGFAFVPLYYRLDYVLDLWLGVVPEYAASFCRLLLLTSMIGLTSMILITSIHSTGKIKWMSFLSGSISLLSLPIIYICYECWEKKPEVAYIVLLTTTLLKCILYFFIVKHLINEIHCLRIVWTIVKDYLAILATYFLIIFIGQYVHDSFGGLCVIIVLSSLILGILSFLFILNSADRAEVSLKVKSIMKFRD